MNTIASLVCAATLIAGCDVTHRALDGGGAREDAAASDAAPADAEADSIDAATTPDAGEILPPDAGDPSSCGAHGEPCCAGSTCGHAALTCIGGLCQGACGTSGAPCCAGFHCSELQTECDGATRSCVRQSVLAPYALCDVAGAEVCPITTVCVASRLDARHDPASFCTADCVDGIPCPGTPLGPMGVCVIAGGGGQCHLPCAATECPSGFVCRSAPGDLGDYWVCVPGEP